MLDDLGARESRPSPTGTKGSASISRRLPRCCLALLVPLPAALGPAAAPGGDQPGLAGPFLQRGRPGAGPGCSGAPATGSKLDGAGAEADRADDSCSTSSCRPMSRLASIRFSTSSKESQGRHCGRRPPAAAIDAGLGGQRRRPAGAAAAAATAAAAAGARAPRRHGLVAGQSASAPPPGRAGRRRRPGGSAPSRRRPRRRARGAPRHGPSAASARCATGCRPRPRRRRRPAARPAPWAGPGRAGPRALATDAPWAWSSRSSITWAGSAPKP